MNKKGNAIFMLIMIILSLVLFGLISIIGYNQFDDMKDDLLEDIEMNESREVINDVHTRLPSWVDGAILLIFVGLWVGGLASVYFKDDHPIIFGLMMFAILFVVIGGAILGNSFEEFMEDDDYSDMKVSFPVTFWVLTHMLEIGIIIAFSLMTVYLAKNRG